MQFLDAGLELVRGGSTYREAAEADRRSAAQATARRLPGFGHRFHTRDPRAARLFQMALELEVEGEHIQMIRAVEMVLPSTRTPDGRAAAGEHRRRDRRRLRRPRHPAGLANALFIISRVPGIAAHAQEERTRQQPMRQIDPKDHVYDGPSSADFRNAGSRPSETAGELSWPAQSGV